jgi:hypothetical protein
MVVTLSLAPAGSIGGSVLPATLPRGAQIEAWFVGGESAPDLDASPDGTSFVRDGAFLVEGLAAGRYALTLVGADGALLEARDGAVLASVAAGARTDLRLLVRSGATLSGRVVRAADGAPVDRARVALLHRSQAGALPVLDRSDEADGAGPRDSLSRTLRTDDEGKYTVKGLAPGLWRIAVTDPEFALDMREDVHLEEGRTESLEHRLQPGATVLLLAEPDAQLGLSVEGRQAPFAVFHTTPEGTAVAYGVPRGRFDIGTLEGTGFGMVVATVDTTPGGDVFADGRRGSQVVLRGRVTRAGAPLAGALVAGIGPTDAITGADGAYEFREPIAARVVLRTVVTAPEPDAVGLAFEIGCMSFGKEAIRRDFELPTGSAEIAATELKGRPASGVSVSLEQDAPTDATLEGSSAVRTTNAQGVARWTGLPAGRYAATARFAGSGAVARRGFEVAETGVVRVVAREPESAVLSVRVLDEAGRPAPGAVVAARFLAREDDPGERDAERFARGAEVSAASPTDVDGAVSVPGLADGVALLTARRSPTEEAAPEIVVVGPGAARAVTLRLRTVGK